MAKLKFLLNLITILYCFKYLNSCGITTHTEIAHRAASSYEYLLDKKISVAQVIFLFLIFIIKHKFQFNFLS